jgi:hypothetical protein
VAYQSVLSSTVASGALRRTDSIPFKALRLVLYPSLTAMGSPLAAFSLNRYSPALSVYSSNLPVIANPHA